MIPSDRIVEHLRLAMDIPDLSAIRYELTGEIGRGGMGIVYLARDTVLNRDVALKVMNRHQEARTLASLEHPGIVPVHDAGILPDGRGYYAMKFILGTRLDAYCAAAPSLAERLRTFLRICEPIAFAHSRGLIHRDLKPENVMIGSFGEVLVLDWGVAEQIDARDATIAGTEGYIAPEQLHGVPGVGNDVFSLGKLLFFLLGATAPNPLFAIVAKACNAEPQLRFSSVAELSKDVANFLDGEPVGAYKEPLMEQATRWALRNKTLLALIVTYVLVRAAIFFFIRR